MAKFKDKATGNVFEFVLEHDIESMRKHPDYEEVVVVGYTVAEEPLVVKKTKSKSKGE